MKSIQYMILVTAFAGSSLAIQAQSHSHDETPQYYAVYERAYHETSKLGIYPSGKIAVSDVEMATESITIHFAKPVSGPAIINIYDTKGTLLVNQYAELNGRKTIIPIYSEIGHGIQFLHVFTESDEAIYEFKNNQTINN